MRLSEDALRGRVVLSGDGIALGEITRIYVETTDWHVEALEIRLRKDITDRLGASRSLFRGATLEVSTQLVQSVGDVVILTVTADSLRAPSPPQASESAPLH
ncbi:MAG: PRC-barrel domain-containing protein [Kofleriaceae bacterium]